VLPQAPQLVASVCVFTQRPPQRVSAPAHIGAPQTPIVQVWPIGHAVPQVPQFDALVDVSTHVPPQSIWPIGHIIAARQAPIVQLWPIGHAVPQAPQLAGSVCVFTQVPLQSTWGAVHIVVARQAPIVQLWPIGHAVPQAPQFMLSVCGLTQVPLHASSPIAQDGPVSVGVTSGREASGLTTSAPASRPASVGCVGVAQATIVAAVQSSHVKRFRIIQLLQKKCPRTGPRTEPQRTARSGRVAAVLRGAEVRRVGVALQRVQTVHPLARFAQTHP
jgi:hypothetical protein